MTEVGGDAPPLTPAVRRRRRLSTAAWVVAAVLALALVAGVFIKPSYVLVAPGDATPVQRVVSIRGTQTYPHKGRVLFLTVALQTDQNVYQLLRGWLDENVDVVKESDILQGRTPKQDERLNQLEMADSQARAKQVALERLGYKVGVTGTGVGVVGVEPRSPADKHLRVGDVIVAVDGMPVTLSEQLGPAIRSRPAGQPVTLAVERDGRPRTVTLGTRATPNGPCAGRAQIGVTAGTRNEKFDFPVNVRIRTGEIGGPSAGLAFTLTILDELAPGDLTGGGKVAVTGTIDSEGNVGPIGGVQQKAVAARRAGATMFLVPREELKDARRRAGSMKVVGVADLEQALNALRTGGGDVRLPPAPPPPPPC